MTSQATVVVSTTVAASVADVWAAVSDPTAYARWSPEAAGAVRRSGTGAWQVGDRFTGRNRLWIPWSTSCRVVTADPEREFAFEVKLGPVTLSRWAYALEALPDGGTRVTETWTDLRDGVQGALVKPSGLFVGRGVDAAERNRATMEATLTSLTKEFGAL